MKKIIFILCSVTMTNTALADGAKQPPISLNANPVISPLKKGQPAPYSGVIFSQSASAALVSELNATKDRTRAEIERAVAKITADKNLEIDDFKSQCTRDKKALDVQLAGKLIDVTRLEKGLRVAEERASKALSESPNRSTWFMLGLTSGVLITTISAVAITRLIK